MGEELKSCPFCGGDDLRVVVGFLPFVACDNKACGTDGPVRDSEEQDIAAWNTRVGEKA